MAEHHLKTWAPYYDAIEAGLKNFEVRKDDRGYQKGDIVVLHRVEKGKAYLFPGDIEYSEPMIRCRIGWILTGGQFGLEPGYVAFSLLPDGALSQG